MENLIENILTEWAYRVNDGTPNPKNPLHIVQLRESMEYLQIPDDVINEFIQNLSEAKPKEVPEKVKQLAKKKGLIWKRVGYGEEGKEGITHKVDYEKGKLIPVGDEEGDDKESEEQPPEEKQVSKNIVQPKGNPHDKKDTDEKEDVNKKSPDELRNEDKELTDTQLFMYEDDPQEKGGQGTPVSRTGECVTTHAVHKVQNLLKENPEMSYEEAREMVRSELLAHSKTTKKIVGPDGKEKTKKALLTKEWITSGLNCLDYIEKRYGVENIIEATWDTPEGNQLVGSTGHGTSADMFIKTENEGVVGISLKKDFKVFVYSGGYKKQVPKLAEELGVELPHEATGDWYDNEKLKRYNDGVEKLNDPKVKAMVCDRFTKARDDNPEGSSKKTFGASHQKRLQQIASRVNGKTMGKTGTWKKLSPQEQQEMISKTTCDDLYKHIINGGDSLDRISVSTAFAQNDSEIEQATGNMYDNMRKMDYDLRDNLFEFLQQEENADKFKDMVINETHINDVLFGSEGPLDKLDVLYGEPGGETMSPTAVVNLFDIKDTYDEYNGMPEGPEKDAKREEIENVIKERMVITKVKGKPVIGVKVKDASGNESVSPIFSLATRARGISSSPTMELGQTTFGSLAMKNGNTDVEKWDDIDRKKYVDQEMKSILADLEDELINLNDIQEKQDVLDELDRLEKLWSKSGGQVSIKNLKKKIEEL